MSYDLRLMSYDLRLMSYDLRLMSYDLRLMSFVQKKTLKMKKILIIILLAFVTNMPNLIAQTADNQLTIFVDGACGMCKDRIESNALKVKGVLTAQWSSKTKQLTVTYDKTNFSEEKLHAKIAGVGHDTKKMKASDKVYDKLPGCCKYRDPELEDHGSTDENSHESENNEKTHNNSENLSGVIMVKSLN